MSKLIDLVIFILLLITLVLYAAWDLFHRSWYWVECRHPYLGTLIYALTLVLLLQSIGWWTVAVWLGFMVSTALWVADNKATLILSIRNKSEKEK